jgi:hypothetical protein
MPRSFIAALKACDIVEANSGENSFLSIKSSGDKVLFLHGKAGLQISIDTAVAMPSMILWLSRVAMAPAKRHKPHMSSGWVIHVFRGGRLRYTAIEKWHAAIADEVEACDRIGIAAHIRNNDTVKSFRQVSASEIRSLRLSYGEIRQEPRRA